MENTYRNGADSAHRPMKYCSHCGAQILEEAVICPYCGCQVNRIRSTPPSDAVQCFYESRRRSKWVAFFLCFFLGEIGAHKFYEGKVGMGILYLFTVGLFGIGWVIDCISLLFKPNPYFV